MSDYGSWFFCGLIALCGGVDYTLCMQAQASLIWTIILALYCLLIFFLSDQPVLPLPDLFRMQDKFIHAAAYALMAFLFWQAWREHLHKHLLIILTVLFCSVYGMTDEWHQSFVAGRDASYSDWIADTLGAFLLTIIRYNREFMRLRS